MKHANISVFVPHIGCPNRCSFCDQTSISGHSSAPTAAEVTAEAADAVRHLGERAKTAELAFFGGSFTAIPKNYMLELLQAAYPFVERGEIGGIRLSTRPDAIDESMLKLLKSYGVTTIELGAQSMDDEVLELALRGHTAEDVRRAARLIKAEGFTLGLQMMLGLAGDTAEKARSTAAEFAKLGAEEVRIYPTVVIKGTKLAEEMQSGSYTPMSLSEGIELASELMEFFEKKDIRVIRVGLHAGTLLEEDMLGGCYHPAFRELCESRLFLRQIVGNITANNLHSPLKISVNPKDCSKALGQHRGNADALAELGYNECTWVQDNKVPLGKVTIEQQ